MSKSLSSGPFRCVSNASVAQVESTTRDAPLLHALSHLSLRTPEMTLSLRWIYAWNLQGTLARTCRLDIASLPVLAPAVAPRNHNDGSILPMHSNADEDGPKKNGECGLVSPVPERICLLLLYIPLWFTIKAMVAGTITTRTLGNLYLGRSGSTSERGIRMNPEVQGDAHAPTDPAVAHLVRPDGRCHCCHYRRSLVFSCETQSASTDAHCVCANCLRRRFNVDFHAIRCGFVKHMCPICERACPCSSCKRRNGVARPWKCVVSS